MKRIVRYVRTGSGVSVATIDGSKKVEVYEFAANQSDEAIKAAVLGKGNTVPVPSPQKADNRNEKAVSVEKKTIPEHSAVPKDRVTRQQMIDALAKAGVTDINVNSFFALRSAYNKLTEKDGGK